MVEPPNSNNPWWGWLAVALIALLGLAVVMGEPPERAHTPRPEPTQSLTPRGMGEVGTARDAKAERVENAVLISRDKARERVRERSQPSTQPTQTEASGASLPAGLLLIRANESGGDYRAYNPTGCEGYGCGGAYQLHAKYAAGWAAEAGFAGAADNAATWPPAMQDAVALFKYNATDGRLWCDWTDYC